MAHDVNKGLSNMAKAQTAHRASVKGSGPKSYSDHATLAASAPKMKKGC